MNFKKSLLKSWLSVRLSSEMAPNQAWKNKPHAACSSADQVNNELCWGTLENPAMRHWTQQRPWAWLSHMISHRGRWTSLGLAADQEKDDLRWRELWGKTLACLANRWRLLLSYATQHQRSRTYDIYVTTRMSDKIKRLMNTLERTDEADR